MLKRSFLFIAGSLLFLVPLEVMTLSFTLNILRGYRLERQAKQRRCRDPQ